MFKKALVGGAAAALALSSAGIAMASGGQEGGQRASSGASVARALPVVGLACDGGVQKRVFNRITNRPFTFNEASGAPFVPGAALVVPGPARGVDTLSIEFSAETQMGGSSAADNLVDWMGLEVLVNGVPIQPYTAVGDVLAITGADTYNGNALQFCTKIRKGLNTIRVRTNLHDGNGNNNLTGWLDDYTLHVEQSQ